MVVAIACGDPLTSLPEMFRLSLVVAQSAGSYCSKRKIVPSPPTDHPTLLLKFSE